MNKIIKEIFCNINQNNTNGAFSIDDLKIFYKILNNNDYYKEIDGYNILSKHYRVPKRFFYIDNNKKNIVGYEYHGCDLLVDYFSKHDSLNEMYIEILNIYYGVFKNTIKFNKKCNNCRIFFEERLKNRLRSNINNDRVKYLEGKKININNNDVLINTENIYKNIIKYFNCEKDTWNIISNCDPNDLNICIDGTFFDYTASGYVPLMCEMAVFMCYNLIQGEYLAIKYNSGAFADHKNIYKKQNKIYYNSNNIQHIPRRIRFDAVIKYLDIIINPIINSINYNNWYVDFKNYFVMKLLAVIDFSIMSNKDIDLSLAYVNLFYKNNFYDIDDFKKFLMDLYGGGFND